MARATAAGRVVRVGKVLPASCIALAGKGVPGSGDLEEAIEAVARTARTLHQTTRRRGQEWKPSDPEVHLRRPAGVRGGVGWIVRVAVPPFVTARDVRDAVADAAGHQEVAKNIRLAPLVLEERAPPGRPGRERLPGQIRRTRSGGPQHRARDLR